MADFNVKNPLFTPGSGDVPVYFLQQPATFERPSHNGRHTRKGNATIGTKMILIA